mmetsp:Transcript_17361/g.15273  ORF Transcript_17361/g.15273 Transcript_17361/m.15273 type:complete len:135 (+) Transcript_17361:671-1075(+)
MVLYRHFGKDFIFKESNWDSVSDAIFENQFPEIYNWDKKTHDYIWGQKHAIYLFVDEKIDSFNAKDELKKVLNPLKTKVNVVIVDSSAGNGKELTEILDIDVFPSLRLISAEKMEYIFAGEINTKNILNFVNSW